MPRRRVLVALSPLALVTLVGRRVSVSRYLFALLAALVVGGGAAPAAAADSASIDFLDSAGRSDPVEDIGRTYVIAGSSSSPKRIYVKVRPPGGAPCAPSANTDSGDLIRGPSYSGDTRWYGTSVNGAFRLTFNNKWPFSGTFMFCTWIADSQAAGATPITQYVTFRSPTGNVSATFAPQRPLRGQLTTFTLTGASEAPKSLYAKLRGAGGAPCAPSYSVDTGKSVLSDYEVNGAFGATLRVRPRVARTYLLCVWLADSDVDTTPVSGPRSFTFVSRPPCVVPKVPRRMTLKGARKALKRARCAPGRVYRKHSKRKRGRVIGFRPKRGAEREPGTAIKIVVSKGRRW